MSIRSSQSTKLSTSQEIEHMRNCEAQEWLQRYHNKAKEVGPNKARTWWLAVIAHITRIRGEDAANDLRNRMNRLKK